MNNYTIERATLDDAAQVLSFGFASFAENNLEEVTGQKPDFDKAFRSIVDAINNEIVFVVRDNDNLNRIYGTLVMRQDSTWWSDEPVLWTNLMFIEKDKRSYRLAKALLDKGKEYAIMNSIPLVFELFAQTDVKKKIKLLKKLDFQECGSYFIFKQ